MSPNYYSTAKPYYRFEINSLREELESAKWTDKKLLIDIKCDGLRLSVGKINKEPFIFVDPELLKEKSPDVKNRLPMIAEELRTIPDNTILDGEFIAVKENEILHRTTANSLLNATNFPPEKLAEYANLFIFDVLFFEGQDIRNQPLHERLEYLQRIQSTKHIWIEKVTTNINQPNYPAYIVNGNNLEEVNKVINNLLNIEEIEIN